VSTLGSLLQGKVHQFDAIWKVARQILKVHPEILKPIVPDIISQLKECAQNGAEYILSILGELGGTNPSWIKADEEYIKQKLRRRFWNERRFAILAVGSIGSVDSSFAKDVIPFLIRIRSRRNDRGKPIPFLSLGFQHLFIWVHQPCSEMLLSTL